MGGLLLATTLKSHGRGGGGLSLVSSVGQKRCTVRGNTGVGKKPHARLELATSGLEVLRAIHCANGADTHGTSTANPQYRGAWCWHADGATRERLQGQEDFKAKRMHQPGIEPGAPRWQREILPLNHWCEQEQ
jgi:hypothetical protein